MSDNSITEADSGQGSVTSTTSLSKFVSGPRSVSDLVKLASDTDQQFGSFEKRLTGLHFDLDTRSEKITSELDGLTDIPRAQRNVLADKQIQKVRRELRENTEEDRYSQLRALKAVDDQIISVESQFATPAHLLARESTSKNRMYCRNAHEFRSMTVSPSD